MERCSSSRSSLELLPFSRGWLNRWADLICKIFRHTNEIRNFRLNAISTSSVKPRISQVLAVWMIACSKTIKRSSFTFVLPKTFRRVWRKYCEGTVSKYNWGLHFLSLEPRMLSTFSFRTTWNLEAHSWNQRIIALVGSKNGIQNGNLPKKHLWKSRNRPW